MKCLSLWQPWASLMVHGAKAVETRCWHMKYRGPLLVHAAKKWDPDLAMIALRGPFRNALEAAGIVFTEDEKDCRRGWNLPFGAILGRVDVIGCWPTTAIVISDAVRDVGPLLSATATEIVFGDYSSGRFATLCRNPVALPAPIPHRGNRLLFDVPDDVIATAFARPEPAAASGPSRTPPAQ